MEEPFISVKWLDLPEFGLFTKNFSGKKVHYLSIQLSFFLFILKENKVNRTTEAQLFHSSDHHEWLLYWILGGKSVKNVQIDPQILPK